MFPLKNRYAISWIFSIGILEVVAIYLEVVLYFTKRAQQKYFKQEYETKL